MCCDGNVGHTMENGTSTNQAVSSVTCSTYDLPFGMSVIRKTAYICDIFQYRPRTEVNETTASLVLRMTCMLIWQKRCNCSHTRILERTKYHRIRARFFCSESFLIQHYTLLCDGHCYCVVTQLGILFTLCLAPVLRVSTSTYTTITNATTKTYANTTTTTNTTINSTTTVSTSTSTTTTTNTTTTTITMTTMTTTTTTTTTTSTTSQPPQPHSFECTHTSMPHAHILTLKQARTHIRACA